MQIVEVLNHETKKRSNRLFANCHRKYNGGCFVTDRFETLENHGNRTASANKWDGLFIRKANEVFAFRSYTKDFVLNLQ